MTSSSDYPTISGLEPSAGTSGSRDHHDELAVGTTVGRYVVVARIAAGGMGVVYLAYDPELDRRVALKLLDRQSATDSRKRALTEAQALARLTHPNVVTVYDVGTFAERIWLAMELVLGSTLTQWSKAERRSWREILDVLVAAGDGLAAAHAVHLAHLDFKPDNVMVAERRGDAQRVLVTDFGLARSLLRDVATSSPAMPTTDPTPVRGTPAYMAPEQHRGGAGDPRIDQFGFCVTAWEALYGERPFQAENVGALVLAVTKHEIRPPPPSHRVPRWLRRALERGLAPDPAKRWPTMNDLLAHLRRGKTRARRRWIAGSSAALAVLAFAAWQSGRLSDRRMQQACVDEGEAIHSVWPGVDEHVRAELRASFAAAPRGASEATFAGTTTRLDVWTTAWAEHATAECTAAIAGRDPQLHAAAVGCLDGQRESLVALLDTLAEPDDEVIRRAVVAASALASPELCADDADLLRRPLPPAESAERVAALRRVLERSRSQQLGGRFQLGQETADLGVEGAQALGWTPLVAAALLESGRAHDKNGDAAGAEELLQRAYLLALGADDPDVAVEAAITLTHVVGVGRARRDDALLWARQAEALLERLGQTESLRAAMLALNRAIVHRLAAELDASIEQAEHGLAIRRSVLGDDHPEVAAAMNTLGNTHVQRGDAAEAARLFSAALVIWEATIGPEHPDTASTILNLGNTMWARHDLDGAARQYGRALEIRRAALGPDHPETAQALMNVGAVEYERGDYPSAIARFTEALAIARRTRKGDHPQLVMVLNNLAVSQRQSGALEESARLFDEAIAMSERVQGPEHPDYARALRDRGWVRLMLGQRTAALADLEASLAIFERHPEHGEHALAMARVSLGGALTETGSWARGEQLCRDAATVLERTLAPEIDLATAWDCLATAALAAGKPDEAVAPAERSLAIGSSAGFPPDRLVSARLLVARALWDSGTDRTRARAEATSARRDALIKPLRDEADEWLRTHPQ